MFKVDDQFLESIGLGEMPEDEKAALLEHIQGELETRVGMRVMNGLSEEKIGEFERIIDGDHDFIQGYLGGLGDYKGDELYGRLLDINEGESTDKLDEDYAGLRWLMENRPDFQEITSTTMEELKSEIVANRESL